MIALVCGGRDYSDGLTLYRFLDKNKERITAIVHGDALGADRLAGSWAKARGVPEIRVPAQWDFYDKKAGPIRNKWMLDFCKPEVVIAFPGGSGTKGMVKLAKAAGIRVIEIEK